MKVAEFKRWLAAQGAQFVEGSKHTKIYPNCRQNLLPRHPGHGLGEGLRKAILKQLRLA